MIELLVDKMSKKSPDNGKRVSSSKVQLQRTSVLFTPHYRTITESGKSHFSRISDALAEFIDNSMEACKINKNDDWKIGIHFDISRENDYGYCVISDNGGGMTLEKLRQFAVYSLDQETKRMASSSQEEGKFISMYGVGAKEAGFYLGQRLRIVTRAAKTNEVMELVLDKEVFEAKFQRNENVFESEIITRGIGGSNITINMSTEEKFLYNSSDVLSGILNAIEEEYEHFTYIILKLSRNIIESIIDTNKTTEDGIVVYKYNDIADELGDIYHFHLHPDHTPNNILQKAQFKPQVNGGELPVQFNNCEALQKLSRGRHNSDKGGDVASLVGNLHIFYSCLFNGLIAYPMISLRDLKTYGTHQFIEKARVPFRFNIEVPDPKHRSAKLAIGGVKTQEYEEVKLITIEGILFYYPYGKDDGTEDDKETRPALGSDKQISLFNILWMNRLVPESFVNELPFFSIVKQYTVLQLPSKFIPLNWKARIKGYLFFDRNFPITNNKLRIQVDPDINLWLNSYRANHFVYKPNKIPALFESWVVMCHKSFDSEYYLEGRYLEYEQHLKVSNTMKKGSVSVFKSLKIADSKVIIDVNDQVKIKTTRTQSIEFARITAFIAFEELEPYRDTYHGPCFFRYKRLPWEIYGNEEHIKSVALIEVSSGGKSGPFVSDKEIEILKLQGVADVKVALYPDVQSMCPTITKTGRSTKNHIEIGKTIAEVEAGKKYYKVGVQLLNARNEPVVCVPGSDPATKSNRYKVKYRVENTDRVTILDAGIESELWCYNHDTKIEEKFDGGSKSSKFSLHNAQYSYYNVSFPKGECHLVIEVLDVTTGIHSNTANRIIFSKSFTIKTFFSKKSFNFDMEPVGFIRLGGMLPSFTCTITDIQGKILDDYKGTVSVSIKCISHPEVVVWEVSTPKPVANPKFELDRADKGILTLFGDQFQVSLAGDNKKKTLFKGVTVESLQFEVSMGECDLSVNSTPSKMKGLRETVPFIEARYFSVQCVPGDPSKLLIHSPTTNAVDGTLTLTQDDAVTFDMVIVDIWENLTIPSLGQTWYVKLDKSGPLSYDSAKYGDAQVKTDGTVCIPSVTIKKTNKAVFDSQSFVVFMIGADGKPSQLLAQSVPVKILPSTRPCSMVIHRGNQVIREDFAWHEEAGASIDDLSFHFLDKNGNYIPNVDDCFQEISSGITCSWLEDAKRIMKSTKKNSVRLQPEKSKLPVLVLAKKCDARIVTYEVTAKLDSYDEIFTCNFEINVTAGAPVAWRLMTSLTLNEGLVVSTTADVIEKLKLVYLVDKHENPIFDSNTHKILPNLVLSIKDPETEDDADRMDVTNETYKIPLTKGMRLDALSNEINGYIIDVDKCTVPTHFPVHSPLYIQVNDDKNRFIEKNIKSFCIPGVPACIGVVSPVVSFSDPSIQISIDTPFPDFVLVISDIMRNTLTSFKPKSLSISVTLQLEAPNPSPSDAALVLEASKVVAPDKEGKISIKLGSTDELFQKLKKHFKCDVVNEFYAVFTGHYRKDKVVAIPLKATHVLFKIVKSNAVVGLDLYSNVDTTAAISTVEICCDEAFPALYLKAITDDGVPYVSSELDIVVRVERLLQANRGKAKKVFAFNCKKSIDLVRKVWCIDLNNSDEDSIVDSQLASQALREQLTPGDYNLEISYAESRLNFRSANALVRNVPLLIRSGAPRAIEIDPKSRLQISSSVVSNGKQKNVNIIAHNVVLYAVDSKGNRTSFSPSSRVKVCIVKPSNINPAELPVLENSDSGGFVQAIMNADDTSTATFDTLSVIPHVGSSTLYMKVGLSFLVDTTTMSCEAEFNFCSDTARSHRVESLNTKLKELVVKKQELDKRRDDIANETNLCKSETFILLKKASTPGLRSLVGDDDITAQVLGDIKKNLERQVTELTALASQFRKAKCKPKINNHPAIRTYQHGVIGQVVTLASVEEESTAHVMSWALRQYMELMVVKDDITAKLLYDSGFAVISNESQSEFYVTTGSGKRPRSEDEIRSQTLPLKKLNPPGKRVAGNPEYLINLLKLDRTNEKLRDTVFWTICKNNILIDNLETALLNRKECIRLGHSVPTYYTRTGERLGSDGILNPNVKMPQNPEERLEYIFGGESPVSSSDFAEIKEDILIINDLEAVLQRKDDILAEFGDVDGLDDEIEVLDAGIRDINQELQSLQVMSDGTTPAKKIAKRSNQEASSTNAKRNKQL